MVLIKEKRIERGLTQPELAKSINRDVPLISKFENYVCLPTPEDAVKLLKMLKCTSILELYDEKDITYLKQNKQKANDNLHCYKLTAELPRDAIHWLTKENLELLKYRSIKDWVNQCYYRLIKRIEKKINKERNYENK